VNPESWWPAALALAVWPVCIVVIVVVVLMLSRGDQQAAVLRAIAEVVRAARGASRWSGRRRAAEDVDEDVVGSEDGPPAPVSAGSGAGRSR
jgi:hypothetical protein